MFYHFYLSQEFVHPFFIRFLWRCMHECDIVGSMEYCPPRWSLEINTHVCLCLYIYIYKLWVPFLELQCVPLEECCHFTSKVGRNSKVSIRGLSSVSIYGGQEQAGLVSLRHCQVATCYRGEEDRWIQDPPYERKKERKKEICLAHTTGSDAIFVWFSPLECLLGTPWVTSSSQYFRCSYIVHSFS